MPPHVLRFAAGLALAASLVLANLAPPAAAQRQPQEIRLTEQLLAKMLGSMSASLEFQDKWTKEIERIMPEGDSADDPKAQAEYNRKLHALQDKFARSQGFASAEEYADVNHTFTKLNAAIDPKSGKWVENSLMRNALESVIAGLQADKTMPATKKADAIARQRSAIEELKAPRHPENIDLFNRHRARIEAALAAQEKQLQAMQEREGK